MGLYSLQDSYSLATWYENNGAFDLNLGTDLLLDQSRHILESDAYVFQGVAFPKGGDINLAPQQTFSGSINLVPNSYIVSMTGFCTNQNTNTGNQFTVRLYDKGAQTDLYYGQFAWYPTVISNMTGSANMGKFILQGDRNKPFGPYFFRAPLIVLPPGVLQVQITNVEAPANPLNPAPTNLVQMLLGIAVPKTTTTMQNRNVGLATDQTGVQNPSGIAAVPLTKLPGRGR